MPCLTAGYSVDCTTGSCAGGVSKFYLAKRDSVTAITLTTGEVTAITMASAGDYFYEINPYQETASFTESVERVNCNSKVTQTLVGSFPCRNQTLREFIEELMDCCCGYVVVHVEANGSRWIWGMHQDLNVSLKLGFNAQLINNEGVTGQAISDPNQETITLEAVTTYKAYPLDAAVVLQTP